MKDVQYVVLGNYNIICIISSNLFLCKEQLQLWVAAQLTGIYSNACSKSCRSILSQDFALVI